VAVTVRTYNIAAYWTSADVLDTIETALSQVSYMAAAQTGTVLTFTNAAGTTLAAQKGKRYLVKQTSTSGTGTGAVFDILRNSAGTISTVTLVHGGTGYAASNTITISGADIGGVVTTDNVVITVSTVDSTSRGSASAYYTQDTATPYTWGVACVNQNTAKKMGQTYYSFHIPSTSYFQATLYIRSCRSFNPSTNSANGVAGLDWFSTGAPNTTSQQHYSQVIATTNANALTLKTYQSGVDANFVVFQFQEETAHGIIYRPPFFLSKYESATQPWSLEDCYTGGIYEIGKLDITNTYDSIIFTSIAIAPIGKRQGEWAYSGSPGTTYANNRPIIGYYESTFGKRFNGTGTTHQYGAIYNRTAYDGAHDSLRYVPVIKSIPICSVMSPVPYYIPSDFAIVELPGSNNISYQDTITISAGEVYKVLQYGNNKNAPSYNAAIAFAARTT